MPRLNNNLRGQRQGQRQSNRATANGHVNKRVATQNTKSIVMPSLKSAKTRSTPLTCPLCPICMSHINQDEVISTVCGHIFCRSCLQQALGRKKNCPKCRRNLLFRTSFHTIFLSDNNEIDCIKEESKEEQTQTSQE